MRNTFTQGFWGFVISCVLFVGLLLTDKLSDPQFPIHQQFVESHRVWFYILIAAVFVFQQAIVRWPSFASLATVNDLKWTVENSLDVALRQYYAAISEVAVDSKRDLVRMNIMLPTQSRLWFLLGRPFLKIYFCSPSTYRDEEIDLPWKSGDGTCGYAWAKKRTVLYDYRKYRAPERRLKKRHRQVVEGINSVLSIPIWDSRSRRVIGTLNLDSIHGIEKTYFDNKDVLEKLEARAMFLSPSLASFCDGVRAG